MYTAVLLAPAEQRSAAEADIGLRPGSRLKLVRTTQLSRLGMRALKPAPALRSDTAVLPSLDQVRSAGAARPLRGCCAGAVRVLMWGLRSAEGAARGGPGGVYPVMLKPFPAHPVRATAAWDAAP